MSDEIEIAGIRVSKADWEATPTSIQTLVRVLSERLLALEEKVNQSSQNSSKPPSTDGFGGSVFYCRTEEKNEVALLCQLLSSSAIVVMDEQPDHTDVIL